MRSKRVLTLLLVICMLFSCFAPAAAVRPGSESNAAAVQTQSKDNTDSSASTTGPVTLRDNQDHVVGSSAVKDNNIINGADIATGSNPNAASGSWSASVSNSGISVDLTNTSVPSFVEDLRETTQDYAAGEKVTAFVILEGKALAESYSSILKVPQAALAILELAQQKLIQLMQKLVPVEVIDSFTYFTNAIVVETAVENLEKIAFLDGVKSVFISPVFYPYETEMSPYTVSSGQMTGVDSVWNTEGLNYAGEGMTIAILDTGLDTDHPSFADAPAGAAWTEDDVADFLEKYDLKAEQLYNGTLTAEKLYYNAKVPFTFNYASGAVDVNHNDGVGDHGTHVAGIAAANEVEGTGVVGMAPNAQIVVMKVFQPSGGAAMYDILNALEDCMVLGVDVANLSLGSAGGFSTSGAEEIDQIFENIANTDLVVDIAAGNEGTSAYGSLWGNYMNTTENPDTATVSSPSTYVNVVSIASVDNNYVKHPYFSLADGTNVFYQPSAEYLMGKTDISLQDLAGQELEYVIVPGLGETADFEGLDLTGKVAVVNRGEISFAEKTANAEAAGAVAVLIWNNISEDIYVFGMSTEGENGYPTVPVVLISIEDGQKLDAAETKTLTVSAEDGLRIDSNGGQMSSFSSWGVTPDLGLVPDIAGVGGNVFSCYDGGQYGLMSGTSMATPQVAGVTALVLQYIDDNNLVAKLDVERRVLAENLMMSTAIPIVDEDTGLEASPRQQGSGLVNALAAVTAEAFLTVEDSDCPKAELGDSEAGSYEFTFTVTNFSDEAKTYALSASLLCEDYATDSYYPGVYFMAEQEYALDESAVTFSADTVTVEAGESATVTVSIDLTDADMEWIDTYFPNGNYVEGFVYLTDEDGADLSLPFLGFYGDWSDAPIFDTGFWYEDLFWEGVAPGVVADGVEAHQFYTVPWMSMGSSIQDWVLGFNPYTGALSDANGDVVYNSKNNVLSPNGDGVADQITDYYMSLMRNAKALYLTWTDAEGNVVDEELLDYIPKTMYNSNYGKTVPFVYSWYYDSLYDFAGLADGTELTLTVSGVLDGESNVSDSFSIPVAIDVTAPELDTENIVASTVDGSNYLTLTVKDAHLAYVAVMNPSGSQVYNTYADLDFTDNGDGTYSVTVEVTDLGDQFKVALCDYGCNEGYYDLTWTGEADNNPEMDKTALYAYQVYDEYILYYYGYDYMFGWSTINKQNAEVTMLQSDAYEYWALTAAEYAGGYIFAVDAGGNFLYMVPGVWNRNVICNIGLNVVDMAFDETTGTMYLASADEENYECCLYTIDLLTGELTRVKNYYYEDSMPWAMTFVDGVLYCCKAYASGLYMVDFDYYYTLKPVTLEDGSNFVPASNDVELIPYYSQSMTYSKEDGKIYWAYYGDAQELVVIDPADWSYTTASFTFKQEYAGVLTLEDDGYTLPASEAVTQIGLSDESLILSVGDEYELTATLLPWNAPVTEDLVWTSANEAVVTVDQNGVVTAVSEGSAVVTVSYGDVTASCTVNVVNISGNMYAYKYYDGNYDTGYWLDIDLETVTEEATVDSPVDFMAADYNGHTGIIYGYDSAGQCYWFNPETGDYGTLGVADSSRIPADMAYDYSSGLMYVIVPTMDMFSSSSTLYLLNMSNGTLLEVASVYDYLTTLACSTNGILYSVNISGILYELVLMEGGESGGGIGGWEPLEKRAEITLQSVGDGVTEYTIYPYALMQTPAYEVFYAQSMCYDHNNGVLLWVNVENSTIYWMDNLDIEPFAISLGDPSGTGLIEYTGTYVIPTEIPELSNTAISMVEAEDMMVLAGASKAPAVNIFPANATVQTVNSWESSDESVAYVDENGMVVGVSEGSAVITAIIKDLDGTEYEATFTVTVKNPTDNIYGYLAQDVATYNGYCWIGIDDADPVNYTFSGYVTYQDTYLMVYSAEYVDGTIYAYGYDDSDWNANFLFLTIDAETWTVTSATDMGDGFAFVYDMAYDYTTGTMYALAGPSDNTTDLYYVNLETGELIFCAATGSDYMFMALAFDAEGTLYAMAKSVEDYDPMTWTSVLGNAQMYTIDPASGEIEWFMDAGATSNMLTTMAYDYDTGYIYWNAFDSSYKSALYLIDPEDQSSHSLGPVGAAGSMVTGLMIFADEYPEIPSELINLIMVSTFVEVAEGDTVTLETFVQPSGLDVKMTWSSSDESVATVDENGVVTGVSAGEVTITVTASDGVNTVTASCTVLVYGADDYFITYNTTDAGFATIARPDCTIVTNVTEGETEPPVTAMAMINGYIYAYDENNDLFITSVMDNYVRTYIGNAGIEVDAPYEKHTEGYYNYDYYYTPAFQIRDMTWDEANGRLLALGCNICYKDTTITSEYYNDSYSEVLEETNGCAVYEVDITTGELTKLFVIGEEDNESGFTMLTVTDDGQAYVYSYYMDYVMELDMTTGNVTYLTTFQNQGVYGSDEGDLMAMTYDDVTGNLYLLFTQNGNCYYLYQFDLVTKALTLVDAVGEVVHGDWSDSGDAFAGLVLNEKHVCDKTALQADVDTANGLNEEDYVTETWEALEEVLAEAEAVLADEDAVQREADAAEKALEEALANLVKRGDKSELEELVEEVKAMDEEAYTSDTWPAVEEALAAAEEVLADIDALQEPIDEAKAALEEALEALVERGDKTELEELVEEVEDMSLVTYTPGTRNDLEDALEAAQDVLNDPDAIQEEVDAAYAALEEALEALERADVPTSGGTVIEPDDGDEDEDDKDDEPVVVCPSEHLTDVPAVIWYHEYVDYVVANGLMTGVTATTFDPTGTMTRAMVWTVLARMDGENVNTAVAPWYAEAQEWAMAEGVSDGTMANNSITREQLVTMLYRYLGEPEVTAADKALLDDYTDGAKVSDWAVDAMAWAISNGIINGVTEDTLDPQGVATRAQVAAILMRYCELAD